MNKSCPYQLSCIVPVYNVEQYLDACVESLLQVSSIRMEIILVDDGSTDASPSMVDRYAAESANVKVIHQANGGVSAARNRGLEVACGTYVAFVDSDDWINPEQFVKLYYKAVQDKADLLLGNVHYVSSEGEKYSSFLPLPESVTGSVLSGCFCFVEFIRHGKFVPMVYSYLYRREWLEQNNLRFEPVVHEDELWSVQALCLAERVVCTDWTFYYYRQHTSSIMHTLEPGKRVNSLLYIANRILCFANRFDTEKKRQVWSTLYVKAAQLYQLAFKVLDKKRDSRFHLETNSLYQLYHDRSRLTPDIRSVCLFYYKTARQKLRNYHTWLASAEVARMPAVIPSKKTVILFYSRKWEEPLSYPRALLPEDILITSDRKYVDHADVVVFHLPTLEFDLEEDLEKPANQRWVGWTMECEENYPFIKSTEFMSLFDYWMSYHQGADVLYPYYGKEYPVRLLQVVSHPFELQKDVCMMISSPFNQSGRQEYLKELMKEIDLDSYGKLFNNCLLEKDDGYSSRMALYGRYKFVIAFENACAEDYVTEKFFDPLLVGAVPVYFGAPNIDEFAPGENCYVDVRNYKTVEELAVHLKACLEDPILYEQYQQWRKQPLRPSFTEKAAKLHVHPFIQLCQLIKKDQINLPPLIKIEGQLHLCSFGDSRYKASRERLQEQAEDFDLFETIHLYNEYDLSESFRQNFQEQLRADVRGFGYWVWKPRIILDTLEKIDNGDILLYMDMGCHLNSRGKEKLLAYWEEVKHNECGFLVSQLEEERKECFWTKGDLLDYFRMRGEKDIYSPQYQTGILFIRKEPKTVSLIQSWLDVYYEDFHLTDDTPSRSLNEPGFVEHRHDQSILSLLLKRHGTSIIPLQDVYRPSWNLYSRLYPILLKRDLC